LKYEDVYLKEYGTLCDLRQGQLERENISSISESRSFFIRMTSFLLAKPFLAEAKLKQPKLPNGERTLQVAILPQGATQTRSGVQQALA
jgi:hypothetical protein